MKKSIRIILLSVVVLSGQVFAATAYSVQRVADVLGSEYSVYGNYQADKVAGDYISGTYTPIETTQNLQFIWKIGDAAPTIIDRTTDQGIWLRTTGINRSGQATGWMLNGDGNGGLQIEGFLYSNGRASSLNVLAGVSTTYLSPTAINSSGDIIGEIDSPGGRFFYSSSEGKLIDVLPGVPATFYGLNDHGTIVGRTGGYGEQGTGLAMLVRNGAMEIIGTLGGQYSNAIGVNNSGIVVGTSSISGLDSFSQHAFLYDGEIHDLGTLGGAYSGALGVSDDGVVLGSSARADGGISNFLYFDGSMHDINSVIDAGLGISLASAASISADGKIIAYGVGKDGFFETYLLTPIPEPEKLFLFLLGLAYLYLYRKRRQPLG